jgi:hypothetical protein
VTLEERLQRYAEKGELVHLSVAFYSGKFHANLALASTPNGYARAEHVDPVKAIELAFTAAPVKTRAKNVTATVNDDQQGAAAENAENEKTGLPGDWTTP